MKTEEIINAISQMNVMEIVELSKAMEKKFDISATAALPGTAVETKDTDTDESKPEKTTFSVVMTDYGSSKISIIKIIRTILSLGLKEAKEFVEKVPAIIKTDISKDEAETLKTKLEDGGAKIEIK